MNDDFYDYESNYEHIPEWAEEILVDAIDGRIVFSTMKGERIVIDEEYVIDLEDNR